MHAILIRDAMHIVFAVNYEPFKDQIVIKT